MADTLGVAGSGNGNGNGNVGSEIVVCARCGAENHPGASVCFSCDRPLHESGASYRVASALAGGPPPERQRRALSRSSLARAETVLGVLIFTAVLGYALFSWYRTSVQTDAYRQGSAAEAALDWDKAAAEFDTAGDYKDAQVRATHAHRQVDERDRLYTDAEAAEVRHDWKTAASGFQAIDAIQPDYKQSKEKVIRDRGAAFGADLRGLAYQVSSGPDAGLYVFSPRSGLPMRLPDSDGLSAVHGASADGTTFVYDVPRSAKEIADSIKESLIQRVSRANDLARVPVLAVLDGDGVKTQRMPQLNGDGNPVFTQNGFWWYTGWNRTVNEGGYTQSEVLYATTDLTGTMRITGISTLFSSRRVLALDPARARVILAEPYQNTNSGLQSTGTSIYSASADGSEGTLVNSVPGDVTDVAISPDGNWLLYAAQSGRPAWSKVLWLTYLGRERHDMNGGTSATTDTVQLNSTNWDGGTLPRLSVAFLPRQLDGATEMLADAINSRWELLTLSNVPLSNGEVFSVMHFYQLGDQGSGYAQAAFSPDGRYLAFMRVDGVHPSIDIVDLRGSASWNASLPLSTRGPLDIRFSSDSRYVIAVAGQTIGSEHVDSVFAVPVLQKGGTGDVQPVATAGVPDTGRASTAVLPNGPGMAFVDEHEELLLASLDGTSNALLANHVGSVWNLREDKTLQWER